MANQDIGERYLKAMDDVKDGGMSTRKAARKWGVKRTALQDRLSGKVQCDRRSGPRPILTKSEEDQFADWLIELANRGFGLSKNDFLEAVKRFLDKDGRSTPFKCNMPGKKWFQSYIKRNPKIKMRKARPLERKRAKITKDNVDSWFTAFEAFLLEKGLANQPSLVWNCDETGFDLQGRTGKVIGPSNRKQAPYSVLSGSREHITMLPCFNACGQWMPPYFIFPGKRIPVNYNPLEGGVEGSVFSMTDSGYMDRETFFMWFANHFIPNLPPKRPVVLLIDGHDSHLDLHTFQLAEKNGIYLYSLLKNATHLVQPADVGLFGHMKKSWYKSVRGYSQRNPNADINKKNFCSVFKPTWEDVMSPSILVTAFRKSGIYPLDKSQVSDSLLSSSASASSETSAEQGSNKKNATSLAFDALDAAISPPSRTKYRRRISENYDLDGSPTFRAWKKLYISRSSEQLRTPTHSPAPTHPPAPTLPDPARDSSVERQDQGTSLSDPISSSTVLREILTYPSLEPNGPPKRKNVRRNLPNFVSGPESMQLLLDEKLKKARQLAEKQNRLKELEKKREEKRKKMEEDKYNREQKKLERERKKQKNKRKRDESASIGSTSRSRSSRTKARRQLCDEEIYSTYNDNICSICSQEYFASDDDNNPWIMCESCDHWMHIECVPIGINLDCIQTNQPFFCHECTL